MLIKSLIFLEPDEIVPVRVYLIVASPFVNVSGLRIDEAATAADYLQDFDTINAQMTASVQEKLEHIQTEMAKPKETVKEVPANKQRPRLKNHAASDDQEENDHAENNQEVD